MKRVNAVRNAVGWLGLLSGLLATTGSHSAIAAEWAPREKITMVTHASPGTGIDVFVREMADIWTKHKLVPQPVIVENVTGGRGERARRYVVSQNRRNAHVLFGYTPSQISTALLLKSDITVRSYTPIAVMAIEPLVLFVHAESPFRSVKDLIEAARQKPKAIVQGGGGFGNVPSLVGKMMADEAGVEFSYVSFKGGGEGVVALLGKHVHFVMEQPSEVDQHVKAGKLRPLASSVPLDLYPNLPTFSSLDFRFKTLVQFRGLVAPPDIAPEAARFYAQALDRARQTPEWKEYVRKNELVERWLAGAELAAFLGEEERQYARLHKEIGLLK